MNLTNRIERLNREANELLRKKKSDTLVIIAPSVDSNKEWCIDVCHNTKSGKENTALRQELEACNTFDELVEALDGYTTNVPDVRRSNEYEV